jgi:hypothetical protein
VKLPYKAPAVVLDEVGAEEPEDIRIEAIAQHCKATIVYEPLDGCDARIIGLGERAIITVDEAAPRERQRFSAAHELGHWMHDRGSAVAVCDQERIVRGWRKDDPEERANRYAVGLLLPEKMFKPRARGLRPTFESARQLARAFQTSLTATALRLVDNNEYPCMLVCTKAGRREWFRRSDLVKELWPVERAGRGALVHRLGAAREVGPDTVDADDWIDHRDAREYTLVEHTLRVTDDLALSLLWWKDESQVIALGDDDDDERSQRPRGTRW